MGILLWTEKHDILPGWELCRAHRMAMSCNMGAGHRVDIEARYPCNMETLSRTYNDEDLATWVLYRAHRRAMSSHDGSSFVDREARCPGKMVILSWTYNDDVLAIENSLFA
ncbi:unnamed protein product [Angiostrongylus costaricensis]|uniref:SCP domain-containing protein n=1 Tax=Angiostrongylus costaricensis TaxID=334426 RepID=A0A0R3PJI9_ANGCS|nr:unnamed protein product [Angiostrongylus costaricensis]